MLAIGYIIQLVACAVQSQFCKIRDRRRWINVEYFRVITIVARYFILVFVIFYYTCFIIHVAVK